MFGVYEPKTHPFNAESLELALRYPSVDRSGISVESPGGLGHGDEYAVVHLVKSSESRRAALSKGPSLARLRALRLLLVVRGVSRYCRFLALEDGRLLPVAEI